MNEKRAFTLIEFLVVIADHRHPCRAFAPALGRAKEKGGQTACPSNLRQVNLAIRLYADDCSDSLPVLPTPNPYPNGVGAYYKQLVKGYLGLTGPASPSEKVFICPSDRILHTQIGHAFTSYTFNGYEVGPGAIPRITGKKLGPSRAWQGGVGRRVAGVFRGIVAPGYSQDHPNAKNVLSFVDGHAGLSRIYWNGVSDLDPCNYEPPPDTIISGMGNDAAGKLRKRDQADGSGGRCPDAVPQTPFWTL